MQHYLVEVQIHGDSTTCLGNILGAIYCRRVYRQRVKMISRGLGVILTPCLTTYESMICWILGVSKYFHTSITITNYEI
jgi:hypothetical protein